MTPMLNEPKKYTKIKHPFVSPPPPAKKILHPPGNSKFRITVHTAVYIGTATSDIYSFKVQKIMPIL